MYIFLGILIMALTTYLIRMLPMMVFRKKINNTFIKSFLYYIPYTVIAAMTFPAILYSTSSMISASIAGVIALVLAYKKLDLLTVAIVASIVTYVCNMMV